MSGSYDKPGGRRDTLPAVADFDALEDVLTGARGGVDQTYTYDPSLEPTRRHDVRAPGRRDGEPERGQYTRRAAELGDGALVDTRHLDHVLPCVPNRGRGLHDQ